MPRSSNQRQSESKSNRRFVAKAPMSFRALTKYTKSFGLALSPTFRICMALFLSLFYVIQMITHSSSSWYAEDVSYASSSTQEESDAEARTSSAFLVLDAFTLMVTLLQFLVAWADYQRFERVLLHSDASLFGLAVGQLVFAGTTSVLQHSGILQLFYAANIMIAMWVAVVDLVDLRPMGGDKTFLKDLLNKARANNTSHSDKTQDKKGHSSLSGSLISAARQQDGSSSSKGKGKGKLKPKGISLLGSHSRAGYSNVDLFGGDEDENEAADADMETVQLSEARGGMVDELEQDSGPPELTTRAQDHSFTASASAAQVQTQTQQIVTDEDVVDEFRVRLDRLGAITNQPAPLSLAKMPPSLAFGGSNGHGAGFNHSSGADLKDVEKYSPLAAWNSDAPPPTDVPWEVFSFVEHRIDSSSCHIYTALWTNLPVVIKLIKAERVQSAVAVSEFEAEAAVLSSVRHPNIVRMLGSGRKPRRFIVLELLDGGSLSHSLGLRPDSFERMNRVKFSYLETLSLSRDLASALDHLHEQWSDQVQVLHRDIKPDNIGWTADGTIKLFDFGLCAVVLGKDSSRLQYNRGYRMTGNTGTLRYMAPEVALNEPYHNGVDVYSFAVVVWQVLAGQIPFKEMGKRKYMDRVVRKGQRPELKEKWPVGFRDLLNSCWHTDKNQRPAFSVVVKTLDDLILAEERLERGGMRRVKNVAKESMGELKTLILRIRPAFLLLFGLLAIFSGVAVGQGNGSAGAALAVVAAAGLYLVLISTLRFHMRGEGQPQKTIRVHDQSNASLDDVETGSADDENALDRDDIFAMSVGLESGTYKQRNKGLGGSFTFNPLNEENNNNQVPLYGL